MPCDGDEGLKACPYFNRECGSPGDESEDGCGLSPDNAEALEIYRRWKTFGSTAFDLLELDLGGAVEKDLLATKLMIIDDHIPLISEAVSQGKQEANPEQSKRRKAPKKG